jgi:hypothetical protein
VLLDLAEVAITERQVTPPLSYEATVDLATLRLLGYGRRRHEAGAFC